MSFLFIRIQSYCMHSILYLGRNSEWCECMLLDLTDLCRRFFVLLLSVEDADETGRSAGAGTPKVGDSLKVNQATESKPGNRHIQSFVFCPETGPYPLPYYMDTDHICDIIKYHSLKLLGQKLFDYMSLISSLLCLTSLIFGVQNALIMKILNFKLFTILGIMPTNVQDNTINIL